MKLSPAWLFCLLLLSGMALAAPEPLLKVVVATPTIQNNSNSNSCTLDGNGQVIIEHTVKLTPTGPSLKSKEVRAARFNVHAIKGVIANAAQGKITGKPFDVGYKHRYFAFQNTKPVFLLDKIAGRDGLVNDSPTVQPLTKFIDSVCGDLSFVAYQNSAREKFADVILATVGVKAAIEICAQNNNGFGTSGSAGACDGDQSGDSGVSAALEQVNKIIIVTPPADAKLASVALLHYDAKNIQIIATSVVSSDFMGETYILNGNFVAGSIIWSVDPASTCKVAGIC